MPSLTNRRILVTRPAGQSSKLAALLEERGATPILIPTIELAPPSSWDALDAALACLRSYDIVLFTSANAVRAFAQRARQQGIASFCSRLAAIGPATAQAIAEEGIEGPLEPLPQHSTAEGLLEVLLPHAAGTTMLLPRAAAARDLLPDTLHAAGATVTIAEAYRTVIPPGSAEALSTALTEGLDAITFTSASTAQNLMTLLQQTQLEIPVETVLASIGPITTQAMQELGLAATLESGQATIAALVQRIEEYYARG